MHYIIDGNVCYLTVCERTYPKKLAYQYLEELQQEFATQYGGEVDAVARPYAFIKFDTFIQRTKKLYSDARTQRNLNKLNDDLHDIQQIMTRNINDIMGQGERLDRVSAMSGTLSAESKKYSKKSRDLARQALIQKYMPLAVFIGIVLVTLILRRYVFSYS
jgi:vesicle transport protein SEC22